MPSDDNSTSESSAQLWNVDHNIDKCALCVVCARNCPTGALRRDEADGMLSLHFNAAMCNACKGDKTCETTCPEEAIRIVEVDSLSEDADFVMLNKSEQAECAYCHEYFAPLRRLDVVAEKAAPKGVTHKIEREFCPLCRRQNLVVSLINKLQGEKAEDTKYRSLKAMVREKKRREDAERAALEEKDSQ
jgi:ferredoxin